MLERSTLCKMCPKDGFRKYGHIYTKGKIQHVLPTRDHVSLVEGARQHWKIASSHPMLERVEKAVQQ